MTCQAQKLKMFTRQKQESYLKDKSDWKVKIKLEDLPNCHIKDVAADRAGDGHVSETLPGHDDTGDEVRYGGARRQESQTHHLGGTCRGGLKIIIRNIH